MLKIAEGSADRNRDEAQGSEAVVQTLDGLARQGALRMIATALEAEVEAYVQRHQEERDEYGHARVVRNGRARPRPVTLGTGTVSIRAPRINDKRTIDGERQRFTSRILPPYLRRSTKVSELLPLLYLHGLSTGDFEEALRALLGPEASGLSASALPRNSTPCGRMHAPLPMLLSERTMCSR